MATRYLWGYKDSWYCEINGSTNYGNGAGKRLQVGKATVSGDTWLSRTGIAFSDNTSTGEETVVSATIRLKVLGTDSCISVGSGPQMYIERVSSVTDMVDENTENGPCTVSTLPSGSNPAKKFPGPTTTATNRVTWSGTPSPGDIIEIDVTTLFQDWWAVRSFVPAVSAYDARTCFSVVLKSVDETAGAQKIAFRSYEYNNNPIYAGGDGPDLVLVVSTNHAPSIPSVNLAPSGRVTGASTVTYDFDFTDADGDQCNQCYINVHTSNAVDGSGKMNAGTTLWDSGWVSPTTAASGRATKTHGGTSPTRGQQYYWQVNVKDATGDASGWSTPLAFDINEYPVGTKGSPAA